MATGGAAGQGQLGGAAGSPDQTGGSGTADCRSKPPSGKDIYGCGPSLAFEESADAALDAGAAAVLAVTPDKKIILGRRSSPLGDDYFLAERDDPSEAFWPTTGVSIAGTPASISPDGLRLIVISEDRAALAEIPRSTIGEPFLGAPDAAAFSAINAHVDELAHVFISIVFTADDLGVVYATYDPEQNGSRLHWASRGTKADPFSAGEQLSGCQFEGNAYQAILPTSFSSDGLALFLYDEILERARVAYRKSPSSDFKGFVDLEERARIFVDGACEEAFLAAPFGNTPIRVAPLVDGPVLH